MSASEKDREAAWAAIHECELGTTMSTFAEKMARAIATARAEGETAGYAKGRREAFSEAIELCHAASAEQVKRGDDAGAVVLTAIALIIESHAALRAKADAEAPHDAR